MNKKVALSLLSATVISSMAASAFAAPNSGIYMGGSVDRYYALSDLMNLNTQGLAKFNSDLVEAGSKNIVFVDFDKKGAFLEEIFKSDEGLEKVKRDLKQSDFEGVYTQVKTDGTDGATYDPRKDIDSEPAGELKVESVRAINATQVEVKFGVEVDKNDAETQANYSIGGNNPVSAILSDDDRKTVILTFATAAEVEVTNAAVVIEPIATADNTGVTTLRYAGLLTFEDTVAPDVTTVVSKTSGATAGSVTVNFSEPIKSLGVVKINGESRAATGFVPGATSATFNGLSLDATKTHTIQFIGLTDQGDNVVANLSKTFTVTADASAPTVELSTEGDHTIILTFNKSMNVASVEGAIEATDNVVKDETLSNVTYLNGEVVPGSDDKKFRITVTDALYDSKTSRNLTVVLPSTLQDSLGNTYEGGIKQVTLSKDTTAPSLTGVSFKKNAAGEVTHIVVKTSEGVPNSAVTPSNTNLTIVNQNGVLVPTTGAGALLGGLNAVTPAAGATELQFGVDTPAKISGKYTFTFASGFVTDQAQTPNASSAVTYVVDFGAATPGDNTFEIDPATDIDDTTTDNVFVIDFGGAVKGGAVAGSATDVANYTLNGAALPEGTTITLNATQQVATITLPASSIVKSDTDAVFTIANVQRTTGETIKPVTTTVNIVDNKKPELNSAVLNNDGTITIGFDETLDTPVDAGDLVLKVNGVAIDDAVYNVAAGVGADAGKYVVTATLTFSDLGDADATNDVLFLDANGNGDFDAGEVVFVTGAANGAVVGANGSTANLKSFAGITSVTIGTIATGTPTGADAAGNTLKLDVVKTVK